MRLAPVTQEPSRRVSSAMIPPIEPGLMPTGPDRPRLGAEGGLDLLRRGRLGGLPQRLAQLELVQAAVAAHEREPDALPSAATTGMALPVVRGSMPRNAASSSIVATLGVSTSATGALGGKAGRSRRDTAISTLAA